MNQTLKGDIVREFARNNPDLPDLTLARLIHANNKELFANAEAVRTLVRYHRGSKENWTRKGKGNFHKDPVKSTRTKGSNVAWEYRAPRSHVEPREDFIINGSQRILRFADIHYPFHSERALDAAINFGIKMDPTILLLDGDIIDQHDQSKFEKDPSKRYEQAELEMICGELDAFRKAFPKARIIWKEGNHEDRFRRYLMRSAPSIAKYQNKEGKALFDIPSLLTMYGGPSTMMGVEWIHEKRTLRAGDIAFWHGHERKFGGKYIAARLLDIAKENIMCSHFHRRDEARARGLNGKVIRSWCTGALCDLSPDYLPYNDWNHGFAFIEVDKDGEFEARNLAIDNGKVR